MEVVKREARLKKEGEQIFVSPDYEASIPEAPTTEGTRTDAAGVNGKRDLRCSGLLDDGGCTRPRQLWE